MQTSKFEKISHGTGLLLRIRIRFRADDDAPLSRSLLGWKNIDLREFSPVLKLALHRAHASIQLCVLCWLLLVEYIFRYVLVYVHVMVDA